MKLRNKKTGEIVEVESLDVDTPTEGIVGIPSFDRKGSYSSLAELNEEWEDVPEEPKEIYYLTERGVIDSVTDMSNFTLKMMKEIGNYFETEEEAEKAVEKLKAWKRLKEAGFKFRRWEIIDGTINFMILPKGDYREKVYEDLEICFGGEE